MHVPGLRKITILCKGKKDVFFKTLMEVLCIDEKNAH